MKTNNNTPEITLKAILLGIVLSMVLAGANAYLGLFAGMTVSASIPAAVISMGVLSLFKKANILDGLPYEDNTFDVVYSSHFIEHIPVDQIELVFDDVYRILKPGGLIRLVTPDLEFLNNEYKINYDKKAFKKARNPFENDLKTG